MTLHIRPAEARDFEAMWPVMQAVLSPGDSYALAPDTSEEAGRAFWFGPGCRCHVALTNEQLVGMYRLAPNQPGLGNHVANGAYMVAPWAAGGGVGRALGEHSLVEARRLGYSALQFNFVVSTNERAVRLWQSLGFAIVGTLPRAFRHARLGRVDAYVMFRELTG